MKIVQILLIVITLLFLNCAIGPNYKRPQVDMPQTWRFEDNEATDVTNTLWWRQFGDTVLNKLIDEALHQNNDIQIASSRIEEFRGRLTTARSAFFPQISTVANGGISNSLRTGTQAAVPVISRSSSFYEIDLDASWNLDIWGSLRRSTEAANAQLMVSREGKRAVILSIVSYIANGYITLLILDKELLIANETANSFKYNYDLFHLQYDQGLVSDLELSQSRSQYEQARAVIPEISMQIAQQENLMSSLLGRNPYRIPRGKNLDSLKMPDIPAGLPSSLLENRPDIMQAEQSLRAANAQIGVVRSQYFPNVFLTGLFGIVDTSFLKLFTEPKKVWSASVPISAPIFNAGSIHGQVRAAEALKRQAVITYRQTIQNAFRDVEDALVDQEKTRERLKVIKEQIDALENTVCISRLRFNTGYVSYLDVLTAEINLFQTTLSYVQLQGHLLQSLVNLYAVMGGGWVVKAEIEESK